MTVSAARHRPAFIVTVDVEGDDAWARRPVVTVENLRHLPRLHGLCATHGVRPVYLATHEVTGSADFRVFMRRVLEREEAEVGMHLHAWNTPPMAPREANDWRQQPLATEYPRAALEAKVHHLTRTLRAVCGVQPVSHRGGRWAFDAAYARVLLDAGYRVDASVTPGISWRGSAGALGQGPDYTDFPVDPYFVDLDHIERAGASTLLEVPLTTRRIDMGRTRADGRPAVLVEWLRPNGRNRAQMLRLAGDAIASGRPCLVLMLHSSDLLPGGSPAACDADAVEAILDDLEALFRHVAGSTHPATLAEFHQAACHSTGRMA